jgi:hypothetical protein
VLESTQRALRASGRTQDFLLSEAYALTALGDQDAALSLLERGVRVDPALRAQIARSPWFSGLRTQPRYRALMGSG